LEFTERVVVVTGGAGVLGSAVAARLAAAGAVCHLPVRGPAAGERFAGAPERTLVVPGIDLTDERAVRELYAGLPEVWASIHCAGGFAMAPIGDTSLADLEKLWSINAVTSFLCSREAARAMQRRGQGGRIVNVVARPAVDPRAGAGMAAYTATKAAVAALTLALSEELASERIWVNAVAPSILDTPANRAAMPDADPARWVAPAAVAEAIAFLSSPANDCVRGAVVPAYGRS
jgi:NAD(P)-dependent dehydrogenase (short-subunit alcohol dehydrogenase family)